MQSVKNFTGDLVNLPVHLWFFIISVMAMCFLVGSACNSDNGVVVLEDYEHAWILCGEVNQGGFIMVNNGHYHDPELNELMTLAANTCPGDNPELYSQTK